MEAKRRPFRAVLLDFGGVLTSPLIASMERFAAELGIELQDLARATLGAYAGEDDPLVTEFELGRISENDFSVAFAERLSHISGAPVEPEGVVGRIFDLRLEEQMLEGVARIRRAGLTTGLLSNSWGEGLYPRDRLEPLFDVMLMSHEVGMRKPDPALFRLAARRVGAPAAECIFVDDHPGHLEAAASQGMTTVLHVVPAATLTELERLLSLRLS